MTYDEAHANLRDRFAAAALTGLLAGLPVNSQWVLEAAQSRKMTMTDYYIESAYVLADAMLARRDQLAPAPLSSAPSQAAGGPQ